MSRFVDFLQAYNCGLYTFVIIIWFWMTFNIKMVDYVNGYLWGMILGLSILIFIGNLYYFFKKKGVKNGI